MQPMRVTCSLQRFALSIPLLLIGSTTSAHDSWIAAGGFRAPVGNEWCCGEHDCVAIPSERVKPNGSGYELSSPVELVPYREALPSQDGQYWRCQRPDGSRRCFFAPPSGV
jgi:hypothetical protein